MKKIILIILCMVFLSSSNLSVIAASDSKNLLDLNTPLVSMKALSGRIHFNMPYNTMAESKYYNKYSGSIYAWDYLLTGTIIDLDDGASVQDILFSLDIKEVFAYSTGDLMADAKLIFSPSSYKNYEPVDNTQNGGLKTVLCTSKPDKYSFGNELSALILMPDNTIITASANLRNLEKFEEKDYKSFQRKVFKRQVWWYKTG